mgnify:CR=1 FL=1
MLSAIKNPLRDGDTERPDDEAYSNSYFINANSATAPGIVDANCNPILERSEVYSGVYGRASISFYAFNSNGNKGIACGLNNLQKIRDHVFAERSDLAQALADSVMMFDRSFGKGAPYQPAGSLRIKFEGHEGYTNYRRELDISRACLLYTSDAADEL